MTWLAKREFNAHDNWRLDEIHEVGVTVTYDSLPITAVE